MLLLPASAAAQRAVAVIDATPGDDAEVMVLVGALNEQLDREAPDALVPVPAERRTALVGAMSEEDAAEIADAEDALTRAQDALTQFDERKAIAIVDTALATVAGLRPRPSLMAIAADLAFTRGLARIARDVAGAERDFAIVRRLDPARTLSDVQYPPDVLDAFRRAGASGKDATLDVTGPDGATVWVDGVELGPANATATLPVGLHLVTVTGDRLIARGQVVDLPAAGAQVTLAAAEAPVTTIAYRLRHRLLEATNDADRAEAVAALVRLAGGQDAILVGREAGALVVWLYLGRTGALGAARATEGETVEDLVKPLRPLKITPPPRDCADDERLVDGVCVKELPFVPPPTTPWYRKRWVQATIGGTLLAGLVTTIVAVVAQDPGQTDPSPMPFDFDE